MDFKSRVLEDPLVRAVRMKQQLRFDARYSRRILQHFEEAHQELVANLDGGISRIEREHIADDGFSTLVDAEDIADDAPVVDGHISGEHAGIKILQ